jgi:hypothetical protein
MSADSMGLCESEKRSWSRKNHDLFTLDFLQIFRE